MKQKLQDEIGESRPFTAILLALLCQSEIMFLLRENLARVKRPVETKFTRSQTVQLGVSQGQGRSAGEIMKRMKVLYTCNLGSGIQAKVYWNKQKIRSRCTGWGNDKPRKRMAHLIMTITSHGHKTLAKLEWSAREFM